MTKKHFEWAAAYVRELDSDEGRGTYSQGAVEAFCDLFREFNPRFNESLFRAACRGEDFFDGRITRRYSKAS